MNAKMNKLDKIIRKGMDRLAKVILSAVRNERSLTKKYKAALKPTSSNSPASREKQPTTAQPASANLKKSKKK